MNNKEVIELIERFAATGLAHMRVQTGSTTVELDRCVAAAAAPVATVTGAAAGGPVPAEPAPVIAELAPPSPEPQGPCITAPLVGTFYAAPAPDKAPYVAVGDRVAAGQTVCLLEAMKMMSEVTAPCDCVIEEILVADGELVSYEAPLIRYRTV